MKSHSLLFSLALILFFTANAAAAIHYVAINGTNPIPPFTSWATAATNINDAVNVASPGDQILVTNGIYQTGGVSEGQPYRVNISRPVTVQSVNGPEVTIIAGHQATNGSAIGCVLLGSGSILSGFTLTNGAALDEGGGVTCAYTNSLITNCILVGNTALKGPGGAVSKGTLVNCKLIDNFSYGDGGCAWGSILINCLLEKNFSLGIGGAAVNCTLINCTVVSNSAAGYNGSVPGCALKNCIVYYNFSQYTNAENGVEKSSFSNCCVSFPTNFFSGANNFTNPPGFANLAAGDFHLSIISPCINAGDNSFVTTDTDLDGNPRIAGGTVDVGAYELSPLPPRHFVSLTSPNPVAPYADWLTAATNIQDAIDAASAGDFIIVSNGIYQTGGRTVNGYVLTNRVVIDKAVTVQSVNGASTTIIAGLPGTGGFPSIGFRCVYLTNGARLVGFTLKNGATSNSGKNFVTELSGAAVWCESTNAVISNCVLTHSYAQAYGGAAYQGTLDNCVISNNIAFLDGGGTYLANLNNCIVVSNRLVQGFGGGGACFGILNNCLISGNSADYGAGVCSNLLNNCLLKNNFASTGGGAYQSTLINCTVVSNTASKSNGGGIAGCNATNCILYYNYSRSAPNYDASYLSYCCTTPLPAGLGNFTNEPAFANLSAGDFHLQSTSPCINAGTNSVVTTSTDLDGNPRVVSGTVDMGAYEFQLPVPLSYYAYLQSPTNHYSGLLISWQSVNGLDYFIQRSTNLLAAPVFTLIQSNLVGQAGLTTYTDLTATGEGPYFYRVGTQ